MSSTLTAIEGPPVAQRNTAGYCSRTALHNVARNCRPNGRRCVVLVFSIAYLLAIKFWIAKDGLAMQKVPMTVLQDARQLRLERL